MIFQLPSPGGSNLKTNSNNQSEQAHSNGARFGGICAFAALFGACLKEQQKTIGKIVFFFWSLQAT